MMAAMLKSALAAICILVVLAVAYLTLSVVVLRPPRVNYAAWLATASVVAALSGLTLTAAWSAGRPEGLRYPAAAAGVVLFALGTWLVTTTLRSEHFEGYALLLGAMLAVEGTLSVIVFTIRPSTA